MPITRAGFAAFDRQRAELARREREERLGGVARRERVTTREAIGAQTAGQLQLFEAKKRAREEAFTRFRSFTEPYLQQLATGAPRDETPTGLTEAQTGVISSFQEEGTEAQGELLSALARRGISTGGVSAAEAGKLASRTGSRVALAKAQFEEQAAQRRQQERLARQQAFSSLFQNVSSQLGAF